VSTARTKAIAAGPDKLVNADREEDPPAAIFGSRYSGEQFSLSFVRGKIGVRFQGGLNWSTQH
jgi:hypothetical protein